MPVELPELFRLKRGVLPQPIANVHLQTHSLPDLGGCQCHHLLRWFAMTRIRYGLDIGARLMEPYSALGMGSDFVVDIDGIDVAGQHSPASNFLAGLYGLEQKK